MKFPRNARIFRGQLDAAPFVSVFLLLVIFVLLSSLIYTPGVKMQIQLPTGPALPGVDGPTVAVAVDAGGHYYFENQAIHEGRLENRLRTAAQNSPQPLTLVVYADRNVTLRIQQSLVALAHRVGIHDLLWATRPEVVETPNELLP